MIRLLLPRGGRRAALAALGALAVTSACQDHPTAVLPADPVGPISTEQRQALRCTVTVSSGDVDCRDAATPTTNSAIANLIVGGQNTYVRLRSTGAVYDSTRLVMAAPVTVQNLSAQPMGTTDGLTVAPGGVRVFFASQPVTTQGTGQVTLYNPDGIGTFTATGQPYYGYPEIIPSGGISSRRVWKFDLPLTVTQFSFQVFVDTPVPDESAPLLSGETFSRAPGALTAGLAHGCAVREGAGPFCWGRSEEGQLGVGSPYQLTEVRFPGSFRSVVPGGCGVSTDNWLYCWGNNGNGEVGDGTTTSRLVPVQVGGATFASVSGGGAHRCAVASSGFVYCWGLNFYGQVGDGSTTNRLTPRGTNAPASTQVATGLFHSCAVTTVGQVRCWGSDAEGQLGDGTANTGATSSPVLALTPAGVVMTQVAATGSATCALSSGGAVYCWGRGKPTSAATSPATPSLVAFPAGVTMTSIFIGAALEMCALSSSGAQYCWGATPTLVPAPAGVTLVQASGACALADTGDVYCRGSNQYGQLGNGALEASDTYVRVNLPSGVTVASVSGGNASSCVLTTDGNALCWGLNASGDLGNGTTSYERRWLAPSQVLAPSALTQVRSGPLAAHSCGIADDGALYCWGANDSTQLGTGDRVERRQPTRIALPSGAAAVDVAPAKAHTCAATTTGQVACWGSNAAGQLGNGTKVESPTPVAIALPGGALATRVATGLRHSCAITTTGDAYCWGSNMQTQLGDSTSTERLTPTPVRLPAGVRAVAISAGSASSCIISDVGAAWCWGMNNSGQVGDGTTGFSRNVPTAVALPAGSVVLDLSVGESHACASTASGTAYCWGDNGSGQIGDGVVTAMRPTPIAVALPAGLNASRVAAGAVHSCATTTMGIIYCWGVNADGQLGNGGVASLVRMPQAVPLR